MTQPVMPEPLVQIVLARVAAHYEITTERMLRQDRTPPMSEARQASMCLLYSLGACIEHIGGYMHRRAATVVSGMDHAHRQQAVMETVTAIRDTLPASVLYWRPGVTPLPPTIAEQLHAALSATRVDHARYVLAYVESVLTGHRCGLACWHGAYLLVNDAVLRRRVVAALTGEQRALLAGTLRRDAARLGLRRSA